MGQKTDTNGCEPNTYLVSSFPGELRLWELGGSLEDATYGIREDSRNVFGTTAEGGIPNVEEPT